MVNIYLDDAIKADMLSGDAYKDGKMLYDFVNELLYPETGLVQEFTDAAMTMLIGNKSPKE
jgi:hypothetical protein